MSDLKMHNVIFAVSKENHEDKDCFACIVMSHGGEGDIISDKRGDTYETKEMMKYFQGNGCTSLAKKPKLFFIQVWSAKKLEYDL